MTSTEPREPREPREPKRSAGYRGTLPAREDRLARPWLMVVAAIFVGIFVLSFLGVPSRFIPDPTPVPLPTIPPAATQEASPGASPTLELSPSPFPSPSPSPTDE